LVRRRSSTRHHLLFYIAQTPGRADSCQGFGNGTQPRIGLQSGLNQSELFYLLNSCCFSLILKEMRAIFLFLLLCQALLLNSQNLIWNGDFESHHVPMDWRPQKTDTDSLDNWGNFGRPKLHLHDYCGGKAYNGVSYIDLRIYSHHIKNYREYAEAKITCPLQAGARYIVHFRTMPIKGKYVIGNVGVYLSNEPVDISVKRLLPFVPTVISPKGKIIDNSHDYILIEDTITAKGGEQYIIIGNFDNDHSIPKREFHDFDSINKPFEPPYSAIYGFDDVAVIPLNRNECPQAAIKPLVITDMVNHIDTIFTLADIHFATDSYEPLGEFGGLYKIVEKLLNRDTALAVKVSGFTDITGLKAYNDDLSIKRAQAICSRLIALGIDCRKIYYSGYGSQAPVKNTTGGSLANRRVELNIAPWLTMKSPDLLPFCKTK
jgi:OOP family OmpA-OmpF porin